jgi:ABC-2 type transport system permease protein
MFFLNLQASQLMINTGLLTLINREVWRFLNLYKQTIFPSVISSSLYIVVFGHSLGSRIGKIKGIDYMDFIIPGLVMMAVINHAYQNSSSSIIQAKFLKFLDDILITPLSGFELAIGYIIGGALRGFINGIIVFLLGWLLTGFMIDDFFTTFILLFSVSWTFSAFGCIIGIIAKSWDEIAIFTNFIFMPLTFLGGVFYSINDLPEIFKIISQLNPLYWMINGLRYSTVGVSDSSHIISIYISIFCALLFTYIASIMFKKGYRIKE